jgi:hypothetical protein
MRLKFILIATIIPLVIPLKVICFIPQIKYIYEELTKANKDSDTFRIIQERTLYYKEDPGENRKIKEKVFLKHPWKYAKTLSENEERKMSVIADGVQIEISEGYYREIKPREQVPLIYGFLLSRDPDQLKAFLSAKGLIMPKNRLHRLKGMVCILLESEGPERGGLYLDRKSFRPLAYYRGLISGADPNFAEVYMEFSDYRKTGRDSYHPFRTEIYSHNRLVETVDVISVKPGAKIGANIFNIEYLKKRYRPAGDTYRQR